MRPAKINLHLGVGAPRADGFHPLTTVYQAISLYDDLRRHARTRAGLSTPAVADYIDAAGAARPAAQHRRPRPLPLLAAPRRLRRLRCGAGRQDDPGRGRAWPAARPTPPPRWSPSTGSGASGLPTTSCSRSRPSWAATSRSRSSGGTALGSGRGEQVEPRSIDQGTWWWVVVPAADGLVHARGLPALRPRCSPTPPPSPPRPATCCWRLADPGPAPAGRRPAQRPAAARRCDLRPDLARRDLAGGEAAGALRGHGVGLRTDLRLPVRVRRARPRRRRRARRRAPRRRAGRPRAGRRGPPSMEPG